MGTVLGACPGELHFDRFLRDRQRDTSQAASDGSGDNQRGRSRLFFFLSRRWEMLTAPRWGQVALFKLN